MKSSSNDAYKARHDRERERGEEAATQRKREADIRKIKESAYYTRYRDRWPRLVESQRAEWGLGYVALV